MKRLTVKLMAMLTVLLFVLCGCANDTQAETHDDGNDVVVQDMGSMVLFVPEHGKSGTETMADSVSSLQQQVINAVAAEGKIDESEKTETVPGGKGEENVLDEPVKQKETVQKPAPEKTPAVKADEDIKSVSQTVGAIKFCTYCAKPGHDLDACAVKAEDEAPCSYCGAKDHKVDACKQKMADAFDIGYWVQYAKDYAVSVGLTLDPSMTKENSSWDAPIPATYRSKYIADDVHSRVDTYVQYIEWYDISGFVWVEARPDGPYEWDLFVYYG